MYTKGKLYDLGSCHGAVAPPCVVYAHMGTEGMGTLTSAGEGRQEHDLQDPPVSLFTVLFGDRVPH